MKNAAEHKAKCLICNKSYVGINKDNLKRHLCGQHSGRGIQQGVSIGREIQVEDDNDSSSNSNSNTPKKRKMWNGKLSRGEFIRDFVSLVVFGKVPFSHFNNPFWRNMAAVHMEATQTRMNAAKARIYVEKAAANVREQIKAELKGNANRIISVKLDVASRHFRSKLGVNVQFYCSIREKIGSRQARETSNENRHFQALRKSEAHKSDRPGSF